MIQAIFKNDVWDIATKDFEPNGIYLILVHLTEGGIEYNLFDLISGLLAFLPGSSALGIDPHIFSNAVKLKYYSSWSDAAGVGANFWAQGWVVGGLIGVLIFCIGLILLLIWLDRIMIRTEDPAIQALLVALVAVLAFYIQRNTLEQILSFAGRYTVIFFLIRITGMALWDILPKRRFLR